MNDALYHYIDPAFSHLDVGKYSLVLLISGGNFSLAVMRGRQLMVWRKDAPLGELIFAGEVQEVLGFDYMEVIAAVRSGNFTLVPQLTFEEDTVTEVARFLDVQATDTVLAQPLDNMNAVVFKIPQEVAEAAKRFNLHRIHFGGKGWLTAIANNQPSDHHLYVNVHDDQFDIAYFKQGKLQLFNTFDISHEDELAYYTAFVSQQLKLDMSATTVVLSGNIGSGDRTYHDLLGTMFKFVTLNEAAVATIPEHLPEHQLLALTSLPLCASLADA